MTWEWFGLTALRRAWRPGRAGMWDFLTERARVSAAVELERERNRGTVAKMDALPLHTKVFESDPDGRIRLELNARTIVVAMTPTAVIENLDHRTVPSPGLPAPPQTAPRHPNSGHTG